MADLGSALAGGAIGALISAFLSFKVQNALARKRREEDESRLAFVYLVKVSDIVVKEGLVKSTMDVLLSSKKGADSALLRGLTGTGAGFEAKHAWCVLLSKVLESAASNKETRSMLKVVADHFRGANEALFEGFSVPPNVLANLPREAVIAYHSMMTGIAQLKSAGKVLDNFFESGDTAIIQPEMLYGIWMTFDLISTHAKSLRVALVRQGKIAPSEAENILKQQFESAKQSMLDTMFSKDKLKAAIAAVAPEIEEKLNADGMKPIASPEAAATKTATPPVA